MGEDIPTTQESEAARQLAELPVMLGLEFTPEVLTARAAGVQAMSELDWPGISEHVGQTQDLLQSQIEPLRDDEYQKANLGLIIDKALMWKEAGRPASYAAELFQAMNFAHYRNYNDLLTIIARAWGEVDEALPIAASAIDQSDRGRPTGNGQPELLADGIELPVVSVAMADNRLLVDGQAMRLDMDPLLLRSALTTGRAQVMQGLENFRQRQVHDDPNKTIGLAPVKVMALPGSAQDVLTPQAYRTRFHHDQSVIDPSQLREYLQGYWQAIAASGFIPEVRLLQQQSWHIELLAHLPDTHQTRS